MPNYDAIWSYEGYEFQAMNDACVALMHGATIRARVRKTMIVIGPALDESGGFAFECRVAGRLILRGNAFDVAASFRGILRSLLKTKVPTRALGPTRTRSGVRPVVRPEDGASIEDKAIKRG